MSALTIGDDEFIPLTLGVFAPIDPGYFEEGDGLDRYQLDETELDGDTE